MKKFFKRLLATYLLWKRDYTLGKEPMFLRIDSGMITYGFKLGHKFTWPELWKQMDKKVFRGRPEDITEEEANEIAKMVSQYKF